MPGVTDVGIVSSGRAVRAATFGQCIDRGTRAARHMDRRHGERQSDATVLARLKKAEIPLLGRTCPLLAKERQRRVHLHFRSNSPLETNLRIADVRPGSPSWARA